MTTSTMILNPKSIEDIRHNREVWAAALESGKYPQGKAYLTTGNRYCCFGVLCQLIDPTRTEWEPTNNMPDSYMLFQVGYSVSNERDEFTTSYGAKELAAHNDTGSTFHEIAKMIRNAPFPDEVPA